ncbi:ankyrin and armadillo repeat-containing protein-like [Bolinopsis microptera]|uniref:ankyrin and armadillo repeat-containing protein-like n=1 Tax=Bolinopsis microptera TaxID=2820187 RepID=UPI003078F7BB
MESPESLSTPSLATVFFDKFEKDELQELLSTKPHDWLFAQNIVDEKVSELGNGLLTNIANPTLENLSNYVLLVEKDKPLNKKKEESFDLREIQQIIRELTVGINVFEELPAISLRPRYDKGTFVDIPPAYIDTHVAQCMLELDYYMKGLWHGAHFGRERRQKFTERWADLMNVNKDGNPETRVDKQAIFKDYGMYDFNKDSQWHGYYANEHETHDDIEECKKMNKEILDSIGVFLLCSIKEAQHHRNMLVFSVQHDISSFTRKGLDKLIDDTHQPLTCWLQSQRSAVREWFTKKPKVRQLLSKVKFITALSYFLVSMKKFSMVPDISAYLPSLTTEQVKTEDTLPPLMLHSDSVTSNKLFVDDDMYCHVHGGLVIGKNCVTLKPATEKLVESYESICEVAVQQNHKKLKGSGDGNLYPMAEVDVDGKTYAMIAIELEKLYIQTPKSPRWLHQIIDGASQTKKRVFPVSETRLVEQFNRRFGNPQKVSTSHLMVAIHLGRSAVFQQTMTKSTKTRLSKCDEKKMSMMHYAAMNDYHNLICDMVRTWGCDVNVRWESDDRTTFGPAPLHTAVRHGAIECVYCLLSYHADLNLVDDKGWLPIHTAAYYNQHLIVDMLLSRKPKLIDKPSSNSDELTPLLLACSSGALDTVERLLELGATPALLTRTKRGVIHLAALNRHVKVLELFINKDYPDLAVWDILVAMMNSKEDTEKYHAVVALDTLTKKGGNWNELLEANAIPALVNILKPDKSLLPEEENSVQRMELKMQTSAVIKNISYEDDVRKAIAATNSLKTFIGLLSLPHDVVQSNAATIISDVCQVNDNAQKVAGEGGIVPLIQLLKNWLPSVLTSAMRSLAQLGANFESNKDEIAKKGGLDPLVQLLDNSDAKVQAEAANALNVVCRDSINNQNFIISIGGIPPLVKLVQSNNIEVQVSAAGALRSLAQSNSVSQGRIAELGGINPLIRLLKSNPRNLDVQEKASGALWALSGDDPTKRRDIGTKIGIEMLIVLLESKSEKIQFVAAKALSTLSCGAPKHQAKIREAGGVLPLVRMLKGSASERVLLAVISTLAALSIGLAHTPVKLNQSAIAGGGAIKSLVSLVTGNSNDLAKVQSAYALACITLAHADNQKLLLKEKFTFTLLIDLLYSSTREVSLGAGRALTTFAYNHIPTQKNIVKGGEIRYEQFIQFLDSDDQEEQGHAAFQVIILARVMTGEDHVLVMAQGIQILYQLLQSDNELIQELAANNIASLAHTRAGIPAALVSVGAMDTLIELLYSPAELVRSSAATAVGYMTFNRGAMRILLTACRRKPDLFQILQENLGAGKISDVFIREWEYCLTVGLPSQSCHLMPVDHIVDVGDSSQSTLIAHLKTTTGTIDTPTYGTTVTEDMFENSSTHRYTSASSLMLQ